VTGLRLGWISILGLLPLFFAVPARAQVPKAFRDRCAVCHQANGEGITGVYPPLAGTIGRYVQLPEGRSYLVHLLLFGMTGTITSKGTAYEGWMPPASDYSDNELAEAIDYVLSKLNAKELPAGFKPITAADFKAARGADLSPSNVLQEREKLIAALGKK
jgi:mono/diheme cytochrome c family protein